MKQYKILIVDDSAVSREILTQVLESDPEMKIIGEAKNGAEAVNLVSFECPDLVLMDLHMPIMDGLEATKRIMAISPTPIVMISAFPFKDGKSIVFEALEAGAVDVIEKPAAPWLKLPTVRSKLLKQLKILANVEFGRPQAAAMVHQKETVEEIIQQEAKKTSLIVEYRIIGIVASTGGPQAVKTILKSLPAGNDCAIIIAQHITEGFTSGLVEWLSLGLNLKVKLADHGELLTPGTVYISPDRHHIEIDYAGRIMLTRAEKDTESYVPSGDRMLSSLARSYGDSAIGIILTGMGTDGAHGLKELKERGALTIAQDEASSVVFGMPKEAIEIGATTVIAPIDRIGDLIIESLRSKVKK